MTKLIPSTLLGVFMIPWHAFGFIWKRPNLWWLTAAPFFINLGLFILFFWLGYHWFQGWLEAVLPGEQAWWWSVLYYLLVVLAVISLLAMQVFLFSVVGRILAAPFLEELTRRVEIESGVNPEELSDMSVWRGIWRVIIQELKKLLLLSSLMIALLLLNLLPGLGSLIYSLLIWLLTCFFLALEFLDYPMERRGLSLGAKIDWVRRLGFKGLAFGAVVFLMGMVPLVNLAFLPLAAVGGTLFYISESPQQTTAKLKTI